MSAGPGVLLTDLYELTMLHAYVRRGMGETAVFELFVRTLPPARGFLLAAGLEQALEYLATLRFNAEELAWVAREGRFDRAFVDYLTRLREAEVRRVFVGGLATDYCVFHTVKDALACGYAAVLLGDAIRAVNVRPDDGRRAEAEMVRLGAVPIRRDLLAA